MRCDFSLEHYRELLEAAKAGGYRFASFDEVPVAGDLLLRHDVDLSPSAALRMAELEAEMGVRATYFVMTRSEFYNLAAPSGESLLQALRRLGHFVGLHAVHPHVDFDSRFDAVLAWHNPEPEYMSEPAEGLVNAMEPRFFAPERYRSDSNQRWRNGCPHERLARGDFEWLQLLVHPEIWVYPGQTMGETMRAMVAAEQSSRLDQLVDDRIDLE
jgi:hypothetical protein